MDADESRLNMIQLFPETSKYGMGTFAKRRPGVFQKFLELANEIMNPDSGLSQLERELIGAHVSKQFGCDFCHLGHLDTADAIGGPEVRVLLERPTPELKVLFDFADLVVGNAVTDAQVQRVLEAGYGEQAVEDVIFVASLFGFANRMVTGFGIHYVQERDQQSSRNLAKSYLMSVRR
jgi:AhpD family alkylhydroperoxidase